MISLDNAYIGFGCWFVGNDFDWSFARLIAPVVTTTSIILSSSKIQNGDILVLANPGSPGKVAVKTEREIQLISVLLAIAV